MTIITVGILALAFLTSSAVEVFKRGDEKDERTDEIMSLLRFMLPLRWFRWCRRDLGGRWELWQQKPRFGDEPFDEWWWFVDAEAARRHREHYKPFKVHAVEDYNVTRIDISHVPEVKHG